MTTEFSYQLFSSRKFPPLSGTFRMLKELGYTQVEGYGALYTDADLVDELRSLLDQTGLTMPSGHFSLDQLEGEPGRVIEIARLLGLSAIFCPHLAAEKRPTDVDGYKAFGQRLQRAGAPFRAAGFEFGWHNHDFEFMPLSDGSVPMERIFAAAPDLAWEADIAWIAVAGIDPLGWIDSYGDRIAAVHVKDIAPPGQCATEDGWEDVGEGTLDWPALMAALRGTSARLFVMEHDNPSDDKRFARRSIAAARTY